MSIGAFSLSLSVKDIKASLAFYRELGFAEFHGDIEQGWLILSDGQTKIGLFQGMFEKNMLTFNPGWSPEAQPLESFIDVRDIQKKVIAAGMTCLSEADEATSGPASFMIEDPDGNPILIDQHV
jgi:catechol 2,3-dioxygenase-like lactoylglutathione lyase family enzyme